MVNENLLDPDGDTGLSYEVETQREPTCSPPHCPYLKVTCQRTEDLIKPVGVFVWLIHVFSMFQIICQYLNIRTFGIKICLVILQYRKTHHLATTPPKAAAGGSPDLEGTNALHLP